MYLSLACPFFNISCQLEVNWICNYVPKVPQITVRVCSKNLSSQCKLPVPIQQAQDKNYVWSEKIDKGTYISSTSFT